MGEPLRSKTPPEPLAELWQAWADQLRKAMQASLEAARIPSAADLERLAEELRSLRGALDAVRTGTSELRSMVTWQQETWQVLGDSVEEATRVQKEAQQAMTVWSQHWEERMTSLTRDLEEWRRQWDEALRQGVALGQASQKGLEELTKTVWDLSQRAMGLSR